MIKIYPDGQSLSEAAAELFIHDARKAIEANGRFSVALSGGSTPQRAYASLAASPYRERVEWNRVDVFWGDERCVPPDDARSNERMARRVLLDRVPVPEERVHPIRCAGSPKESAKEYEAILRAYFGSHGAHFDLVFLGLGENGHTASLFPDTAVLNEATAWAAEVYVPEQNLFRVTLTAPLLNSAKRIVFLVTGESKAAVLKETIEGPADPNRLPAQLIRPEHGELLWMVDNEAGRLLNQPH